MRHVVLGVQVVRQSQPVQIRRFGGDDFLRRGVAGQQLGANPGEFQIRLTGDHVVGQPHDFLCLDLETDFRSAQDDGEVGPHPFQGGDDLRRLRNVPDVNTEADDFGASRQQHFHDIERLLLDVELDQAGARFQIAQVGQQITQAKGGMNVFCVQCGQDDVGHKVGGIYHAPLPSSKRNKDRRRPVRGSGYCHRLQTCRSAAFTQLHRSELHRADGLSMHARILLRPESRAPGAVSGCVPARFTDEKQFFRVNNLGISR